MECVNKLMSWLKQVRSLLFSIVGILPVIVILLTAIDYGIYVGLEYYNFPEWAYKYVLISKQFIDLSATGLVLMFVLSKQFRYISWVSYCCLCGLWILNTVYISFNLSADVYFYAFSSIIYLTFVILTIWRLINR